MQLLFLPSPLLSCQVQYACLPQVYNQLSTHLLLHNYAFSTIHIHTYVFGSNPKPCWYISSSNLGIWAVNEQRNVKDLTVTLILYLGLTTGLLCLSCSACECWVPLVRGASEAPSGWGVACVWSSPSHQHVPHCSSETPLDRATA